MTWTAEVSAVNQRWQWGVESTSALGTAVAANKLLNCFDMTAGINADVGFYTDSGYKYPSIQEENFEQTDLTLGGALDFNGVIYPLASAMGSVAPVAHGASSTAKDWIFKPPITGSIVPQTYSLQQGDSVRARKMAYGIFSQFGYKATRKTMPMLSGKGFAQPLSDGITLTSSPTAVALAPVVNKFFNVYLDTSSGAIGTTQLLRCFSVDFSFDSIYNSFFALNRSTVGFTGHVDAQPKSTIKLLLEADANGLASPLSDMQAGTLMYLRVQAQGNVIDAPNSVNNLFTHDMCITFGKPSELKAEQEIYALEWECTIMKDLAWNSGQSQSLTVTNLITAL